MTLNSNVTIMNQTEITKYDTVNQISVKTEYNKLRDIVIKYFDRRFWFLTEAAISVVISCILSDSSNPLALIFVDGPSTEKTTVLDLFDGLKMTYKVDKFTPASFLSQAANVNTKDLSKVDLLPKIVYKTLLIPEMAPTFNQPKESLLESYALLARILDGNGLVTTGGIHGTRKLEGDYLFGILGATTPLGQTAWNAMGKVGSRLVFLHAPAKLNRQSRQNRAKAILKNKISYYQKKKAVKDAVRDYLMFFFNNISLENYNIPEDVPLNLSSSEQLLGHCGYSPRSVDWNREYDDEYTIDKISFLAEFLTACRSDVKTWSEKNDDGITETNSTGVVEEGVERFTSVIYNFARCHALISGRSYVSPDDLPLIIAISISSLPDDRRRAIELLIESSNDSNTGTFSVSNLRDAMSCNDKTALKIIKKLEILGIGHIEIGSGSRSTKFNLHVEYSWLTSKDFQQYYRVWDSNNK